MKALLIGCCAVVVFMASGCNLKPAVEVDKIGNEYAQHAYSRNAWHPNWDRVTYCWKLDEHGFCPKEDTRVETITTTAMEAPGQAAAKEAAGSVPMAAGLGVGLSKSGSKTKQNVGGPVTNEHFSTKCNGKCF